MKIAMAAIATIVTSVVTVSTVSETKKTEPISFMQEPAIYQEAVQHAETFYLTVNGTTLPASFADNPAVDALKEKLSEGDITFAAHDYGNFEKVGFLDFSLPRSDEQMKTESGDLMLYQGNQLTLFYDSNSWSYTKIAHVDMPKDELKQLLGNGDVSITLSLTPSESYPYTMEDVCLLQNFLLARETKDLNEKPYDLNADDQWDVLDLCLMKKEILGTIQKDSTEIGVIYFSATSNTEGIADRIADYLDVDMIEIEPAIPYTTEDIQYTNSECRANKEQNDEMARPEIANEIDVSADVIYLGYPIWWGVEPKIIDTFLENYNLSGKVIIPFCTSGGSEISASETRMKRIETDTVTWLEGKRFHSGATDEAVHEWVDKTQSELS